MPAGISRVHKYIITVSVLVNPDTDVCYAWHDFPFHIMLDKDMKGIAFCQSDGVHMKGVLVVIDAGASDFPLSVDQVAVQGVVMAIAGRPDGLLDNQAQA